MSACYATQEKNTSLHSTLLNWTAAPSELIDKGAETVVWKAYVSILEEIKAYQIMRIDVIIGESFPRNKPTLDSKEWR